jgi:hypothetical protein
MSLRWTAVLCAAIVILAVAYVAAVLFLAVSPGGSTGGSTGQVSTGKSTLASKAKILPKTITLAKNSSPVQETTGMQPTQPNMTIIAKTGGNLLHSSKNVEVNLTNPPLLIDLAVVPKIVTETKWFVNRTLTKNEEIVQVPVVSRSSFVNLSVIEKVTGRIVAREGFGGDYSTDRIRAIKVYEPGNYIVQIYGNDVAVQALLSTRTPGLTF